MHHLSKRSNFSYSSKSIVTNEKIENQSNKFVNLLGYVILIFMAIDYVSLLISPQFFNPNWELETMGKIIETVYVTLLGFMLVFFRLQQQPVKQLELRILSSLSWLALLLGIICFLFTPLLINNSFRISNLNQAKISLQLANKRQQVEQLNLKINNFTDEQVQIFGVTNQLDINKDLSPDRQKQKIISKIKQKKQLETKQLKNKLINKKRFIFKMTLKWLLGAIIAGVFFINIWKYTEWARVMLKIIKLD